MADNADQVERMRLAFKQSRIRNAVIVDGVEALDYLFGPRAAYRLRSTGSAAGDAVD